MFGTDGVSFTHTPVMGVSFPPLLSFTITAFRPARDSTAWYPLITLRSSALLQPKPSAPGPYTLSATPFPQEHVPLTLTEELKKHPRGLPMSKVKLITWQLLQATAFMHDNKAGQGLCRA